MHSGSLPAPVAPAVKYRPVKSKKAAKQRVQGFFRLGNTGLAFLSPLWLPPLQPRYPAVRSNKKRHNSTIVRSHSETQIERQLIFKCLESILQQSIIIKGISLSLHSSFEGCLRHFTATKRYIDLRSMLFDGLGSCNYRQGVMLLSAVYLYPPL